MSTLVEPRTEGQQLKELMESQGRSYAWLARETGYSESYIFKIVSGSRPWTPEFGAKVQQALGFVPTVIEKILGRYVAIPRNVYERRAEVTIDDVAFATEQAWKESWLREHAATALAEAAERAYQHAVLISGYAPTVDDDIEDEA